jgi:hypothetical protein
MKAKFNNGSSDTPKIKKNQMVEGDYATMIKMRKEKLPEMEANIQELLNNFHGESIGIVLIKEDENGDVEASQTVVMGLSYPGSQLALAKAMRHAADETIKRVAKSAIDAGPDAMISLLKAVKDMGKED